MFGGMKQMGDLMKLMGQAGKIKENVAQARERARNRNTTGQAGAGLVTVTANGLGDVVAVKIEPEALTDQDSLGPLVAAAANAALAKAKEILMEEMRTAMGGIELPPELMPEL